MADLFASNIETIRDGVVLLRGFADARVLLPLIDDIASVSPFRSMTVPGGKSMSVATTSCGARGWYTDARGYRYETIDPVTGRPWPAMPDAFRTLAIDAAARAGFVGFDPDSCLINRYAPGAKMGAHVDKDELDFNQPIVSVSLGLPARFKIADAVIPLSDGDVVVFGGPARKAKHGVSPVAAGALPYRFNLTFRRAGP
ncbi:alpha-ketoglutarate-dependent dioxygenase AlkB [Roseiterribacter gracilis]|uniref:Alpha-ketoglutarate-dependent dioxygenase AlkB n=1 Tax=Roseiterribacter gracilis TaxID=2812848 RepID=A0A8S8XM73_9PROT|nr:alpha-ketoglutarate-dependent dioxygenase AlkB [Rhodospirillales bacterium TMPK1]